MTTRLAFAAAALLAFASLPVNADPIADFYSANQIKIYIRADPGGNYDLYSRLVARHLPRFIPGHPNILPINMPGGGGLKALNYAANVAPKDGTVLTIITQTLPMEQALGTVKELETDLRKLNWIGNLTANSMMMLTSPQSATKKFEDAQNRETIVAVTGAGSVGAQFVTLMNESLKTRFKLIQGYPSGPAMSLAMERGEVEARLTSNPQPQMAAAKAAGAGAYNIVIQAGVRKEPGFESVPLLSDLATTPDQKAIFEYFSKVISLSRPMTTTAGVPPERVEALRQAFDAMMRDPQFLDEGRKGELELDGMGGAQLQKIITEIVDAPADVLEKVRQVIK